MPNQVKQVRTRVSTAHTAVEAAAKVLHELAYTEDGGTQTSTYAYMQREFHKILGRLEALDAGLAHLEPPSTRRRSRSTIEGGGDGKS